MTNHQTDIYIYYTVPLNLCDAYQTTIIRFISMVGQICHIQTNLQQRIEVTPNTYQVTWLEIYKQVEDIEAWKEAIVKASQAIDYSLINKIRHSAHEEYFYSLLTPNIQSTKH